MIGGKFLRFMSGPKSQGSLQDGSEQRGSQGTSNANINFAIPSRQDLFRPADKPPKCFPELLFDFLQTMSSNCDGKSYKLSVDGKKISQGGGKNMADIDC